MKAIVVEPSRLYRQMLSQIFTENEITVQCFEKAKTALAMLEKEGADIICTAMQLPDMDGLALCSQLRAADAIRLKPILLIASEETTRPMHQMLQAGVTEVFQRTELNQLAVYLSDYVQQHWRKKRRHGHILYVEESDALALLTGEFLRSLGYKVEHGRTAEAALEIFTQAKFDLVLTDSMLEGKLTGIMLIRELRKLPGRFGEVPVLAMSGFDDPRRKVDLLHAGASDYLAKPALEEELAVRVGNLVSNRQLLDKVRRQQAQLHELAMRDQLTGLYNRHYLMDSGPKILRQANRQKYPVSMIIVDIDHFKQINDTHGHTIGDLVISRVAKLLRRFSREEDLAARFGGEEFVLLLPYCGDTDAMVKAEILRREIELLNHDGIHLTASFGVTPIPAGQASAFESVFEQADKAVYLAKQNGRNRIEMLHLETV
jgi:two-component system, cell cycle response regulator